MDENSNDDKKVIDLEARREAKKPKRVNCLTMLLEDPPKPVRPTTMRQATPEEMEQRKHWNVGPFHRMWPQKPSPAEPSTPPSKPPRPIK